MKFVSCNCPVGMKYHALNCSHKPGQPQNIPVWVLDALRAQRIARRPGGGVT